MFINPVAAESATSAGKTAGTVDAIKSGAINAAQWLGRQVSAIKDVFLGVIAKIVKYVKPLFSKIGAFFGEIIDSTKDWVSANREIVGPVAITAVVAIFLTFVCNHIFCKEQPAAQKPATT